MIRTNSADAETKNYSTGIYFSESVMTAGDGRKYLPLD